MERRYEHQPPSHKTVDELQNRDWILLRKEYNIKHEEELKILPLINKWLT